MGVGGHRHALAALTPAKRPGTHFTGGCVGLKAGVQKISSPPGFDLRTVEPVVSRSTYCAVSPHTFQK